MDELILAPGIIATDETLTIPETTSFEGWDQIGKVLRTIEKANQFWVGDWINFGMNKFPDRYARAAEATGYNLQVLYNIARVARKFTDPDPNVNIRNAKTDFTHHQEVADLPIPVAERLLEKAVKEKLTTAELRAEVREYRQEHAPVKQDPKKEIAFSWLKQDRVTDLIDHINAAMSTLRWMAKSPQDPETAKYLIASMNKMFHMLAEFTDHLLGNEVVAIPEEINALLEVNDDPTA